MVLAQLQRERQEQVFAVRWDDAAWKEQLRQLFYSGVQGQRQGQGQPLDLWLSAAALDGIVADVGFGSVSQRMT